VVEARSSLWCVVTLLAWATLTSMGLAHLAGVDLPPAPAAAAAALAVPTVLVAAARALLAVRRGPRLVEFDWDDAVRCAPEDADVVRSAAQLRGTMGGAGHLHPRRLVVAAAAWAAAAAPGLAAFAGPGELLGWAVLAPLLAAAAAFMFPARPFYYREAKNGALVTSPPAAAGHLLARRGLARHPEDTATGPPGPVA
jgi:hypothetical protein